MTWQQKLAVSNIAWSPQGRFDAYQIMADSGVKGLEIAPGLFLPNVSSFSDVTLAHVATSCRELKEYGLELVSMQSLLFKAPQSRLFGERDERRLFLLEMTHIIELAGLLEIPNLVFGSPVQRNIPETMSMEEAQDIFIDIFNQLAHLAAKHGTRIALEPNPSVYNTNFMTTLAETIKMVSSINHPGVTFNFDMGEMILNGEGNVEEWIAGYENCKKHISHMHLSNPQLDIVPENEKQAVDLKTFLNRAQPKCWVSLEMKAKKNSELRELKTSLNLLKD